MQSTYILALAVIALLLPTSIVDAKTAGTVVARVNGADITEGDVEDAVRMIAPRGTFHGTISEEKFALFRDQAVNALIDQELQYQAGNSAGIKADSGEVNAKLKAIRRSFSIEDEFRASLVRRGISEEQLKDRIRKTLIARAAVERFIIKPSQPTEKEMREYYAANPSKFRQPEGVRLRMIYTRGPEKARGALARIRAGEDFGAVAAELSEDNYRIKGGDLGYIHRGRIYPELETVAFSLKAGEVSEVILAKESAFILKVEERRPERPIPFDEAHDSLKRDLQKVKQGELFAEWMSSLRSRAKIEKTQ